MACGQGGIVCEMLFVCLFLTLEARLVAMNFLQSIVSIETVTVFYFHMLEFRITFRIS